MKHVLRNLFNTVFKIDMSFLIRRLYDELRVRKCERESVGYYLEVIYFDIKPLDRPTVLPTEVRTLAKEA